MENEDEERGEEAWTNPKGSPTTKNETSTLSASLRISSESVSTISRGARMTSFP